MSVGVQCKATNSPTRSWRGCEYLTTIEEPISLSPSLSIPLCSSFLSIFSALSVLLSPLETDDEDDDDDAFWLRPSQLFVVDVDVDDDDVVGVPESIPMIKL
jgi:hypothetical protein